MQNVIKEKSKESPPNWKTKAKMRKESKKVEFQWKHDPCGF
jgi:hypothetical protein